MLISAARSAAEITLLRRELDRCEKSFRALRARNDFSPFGPRFARPKRRN
jgi:hypothetical protein